MARQHPWTHALDRIAVPAMIMSVVATFSVIGLFFSINASPLTGLLAAGIAAGGWLALLVVRAGIGLAASSEDSFGACMMHVARRDARGAFNYIFFGGWIALCVAAPPVGLAVLGVIVALAIGYIVVGLKSSYEADPPPGNHPPDPQ